MRQITFLAFSVLMTSILSAQTIDLNMETILINNEASGHLFTQLYRNEGKETILLLHGGPGFPGDLTPVAGILSENFQVITFHQRGTKLSPCNDSDYSMDAYVADIETVISYLGIRRFHLFGHSWGGLYAQLYAQIHPERLLSLFLCCPGSGTGKQWKQTEKEVFLFNKSVTTSREWATMGLNNLFGMLGSDKAYMRLFGQVLINYNHGFAKPGTPGNGIEYLRAVPVNRTRKEILNYPELDEVATGKFKVTIVYGDNDIYKSSKKFVIDRFPLAVVSTVEDSGHLPWLHNPKRFKEILTGHFHG